MRAFISVIIMALALAGCGVIGGITGTTTGTTTGTIIGAVTGPEAQRTVYAINAAYIGVLQIAVAYEKKPRCSATVTTICSNPAIVDQLRKANATAKAALEAAETAVRTPSLGDSAIAQAMQAAQIALAAFSALTSLPGVTS